MPTQTIYIVTYPRGTYAATGKTKPYHWAYFVPDLTTKETSNIGTVHQLRGMPGAFYYPGAEPNTNIYALEAQSQSPAEQLEIGAVDSSQLASLTSIYSAIPVDSVESSGWNCQNWSLEAFTLLQAQGYVYDHLTVDGVAAWLRQPDSMSEEKG